MPLKADVSIITPSFNSSRFLQETVDSVLSQTYQDWEMIIVDECSRDDSYDLAQENARRDPRIMARRLKENCGPAVARNTAIEMAKGQYIAFLDSDDIWLPQKLDKQIAFMRKQDAVLSYTAYEKIDEKGNRRQRYINIPPKGDYDDLLKGCFIGCLTAVYDAKRLGKVYMPQINRGQDYGLWLKILRSGYAAFGLDEVLALYRERQGTISSSKLIKAYYQWRIYRDLENISFLKSICFFYNYGIRGMQKKII